MSFIQHMTGQSLSTFYSWMPPTVTLRTYLSRLLLTMSFIVLKTALPLTVSGLKLCTTVNLRFLLTNAKTLQSVRMKSFWHCLMKKASLIHLAVIKVSALPLGVHPPRASSNDCISI